MWGVALSALTIAVAICTALGLVTSFLLVIPFIASTTARRFGVVPMDASIDRDGLWLGDTLVAPRADILDVWAANDQTDHRVSVAVKPDELLVLLLPNAEQARRFARELAPRKKTTDFAAAVVAGYRPRALDALYPLRLFFVIGSFIANSGWKNPAAFLLFVFFALGAYGLVVATQIQSGPDGLTLRKLFGGTRHVPWSDVTAQMLDALPARIVRSPLLTTSAWTKAAHARVIAHAKTKLGPETKKRPED